ncbi:hypothetical protein AALA17_08445 [Lactobacillaceae bacterium 24-114]
MENEHGGKRLGAGRKLKYGQQTMVVRLPVNLVEELEKLSVEDLNKVIWQLHEFNSRRTL